MLWWSITGLCHAIRNHQWLSCLTAPTMLHAHSKCPLKCCCHQISPVAATLHAHSECPLKWCCHQISPVTAMLHAHSECPLKWCCHQISPVAVMLHAHSECPLKWCHEEQLVTAVSHQFDAHSEYPVNQCRHQRSPTTMFHSHYNSKHTVNIQWNLVAIRDHQPVCLTVRLQAHSDYTVKQCRHQRSPATVSQATMSHSHYDSSTQWISSEKVSPSKTI